jgi:RNA polymerase subunit RPABC4/transcription elongation factor Spt4
LVKNVFAMEILVILVLWVLFGVAIGAWARAWGRDFLSYALLGGLMSPIIGAIVLLIKGRLIAPEPRKVYKPTPDWDQPTPLDKIKKTRICPHCDRPIHSGTSRCRECGATLGWRRIEGAADITPFVSRLPEPPKVEEPPKIEAVQSEEKVCPDCAETIKAAAKVCRYCGYRFESEETG